MQPQRDELLGPLLGSLSHQPRLGILGEPSQCNFKLSNALSIQVFIFTVTGHGRVAYLGTLYSGYSSATLAAKSLQWEMDWAQMCLPDAAGLSNTRICAMAASCTCTAPIQMSLYSSVQPATTNRPASSFSFFFVSFAWQRERHAYRAASRKATTTPRTL